MGERITKQGLLNRQGAGSRGYSREHGAWGRENIIIKRYSSY